MATGTQTQTGGAALQSRRDGSAKRAILRVRGRACAARMGPMRCRSSCGRPRSSRPGASAGPGSPPLTNHTNGAEQALEHATIHAWTTISIKHDWTSEF